MEKEVIEAVSRCRMDIQELKGMMKMHFKENTHHHCPCPDVETTRKVAFTVAWWVTIVTVCIVSNIAYFIIRSW